MSRKFLRVGIYWVLGWVVLIILSFDFFNWGRKPQLYLGLPAWLWWEVGIVLLASLVFFLLSRFAWEDE